MKIIVNGTAQKLTAVNSAQLTMRNLGPATVWVGKRATVTAADGFPLYAGDAYEMPQEVLAHGDLWVVTDGASTGDLRVLVVG